MSVESLLFELEKQGYFVLQAISVDDVMERATEHGITTTREQAAKAAQSVAHWWDSGDEWSQALEWTIERLEEDKT